MEITWNQVLVLIPIGTPVTVYCKGVRHHGRIIRMNADGDQVEMLVNSDYIQLTGEKQWVNEKKTYKFFVPMTTRPHEKGQVSVIVMCPNGHIDINPANVPSAQEIIT